MSIGSLIGLASETNGRRPDLSLASERSDDLTSAEGRARVAAAQRRIEVRIGSLLPSEQGRRTDQELPNRDQEVLNDRQKADFRRMADQNLTVDERDHLAECEALIEAGLASFVEVGDALVQVRDSRLYRVEHGTFEDYCRERWGLSRTRSYDLIDSAMVAGHLSPIGDTPAHASQARELAPLRDDPEAMADAWRQANETAEAEGRKVTANDVRNAVRPDEQTSTTTPATMLCPYCEEQPGRELVNVPDAGWCCPDCDLDETDQAPAAAAEDRPADALDARSSCEPVGDSRTGGTRPSGPAPTALPTQPRRKPFPDAADKAAWGIRKAAERIERMKTQPTTGQEANR